jgi:hypothetical protein
MKKTLLLATLLATFAANYAFAQATVSGSSGSIDVSTGPLFYDATISLTTTANQPPDITALNLLLRTPNGPNSGAGIFNVRFLEAISPFTTSVGTGATSTFAQAGTGPNSGFTLSTPITNDLGAAASSPIDNSAGNMNLGVVVLRFTLLDPAAFGTYSFSATLGGINNSEGSFVNGSTGSADVTGAPNFNITVVPEPSTWALIAVGGAALGMQMFRRRKA